MSTRNLHLPEEILLSNGIPVLLQHYDGPVAATYWWINTGSADEKSAEAGFAHFLEHMLFKDAAAKETGQASEGQTARAIESLGGDINAYTSFDQTVYHVTCAEHQWEKVIDAFGIMAAPQKFLKQDFEREREVILEELRKNEDSPGRMLFQTLFGKTFRKHPYGRPVIGFTRTLKAAKVTDLEAFYRRRYISGRMGIIMVGPIGQAGDSKNPRRRKLIQQLEKRFGKKVIPSKAAGPAEPRVVEPAFRKAGTPIFSLLPFDVKTPTISVSFRVPGLDHEDIPALDLIGGILGMGELSRLYQRLFYQTSLATDASGGVYVPRDPGMIYFQSEVAEIAKVAAATEEMIREIRRLRDEGPTADELERVITNVESERLYSTQTADGMASRVGYLKFVLGDMDYDRKYLEQLRAVDSAKLREVAHRYFVPERMAGVVLVPKEESKFELAPLEAVAESLLKPVSSHAKVVPGSKKSSARKGKASVELMKLPSGIRVVHFERPHSHVFSLHAAMLGGLRLELSHPVTTSGQDWGSSYMMSLTWTKGTGSVDARQIASIVEGRAASLDGFAGRNTVGLQMTGLARDWDRLSGLYLDVLLGATFPEGEVDHSRRVAEDSVRGIEDHSSQLCSKLFLETLFENHPYGKLTTGSLESLAGIDSARLKEFHRRWARPERMVIALSGNIPASMLELWMEDLEARAGRIAAQSDAQPIQLESEPDLKGPRWVEKTLGREQTHILVGGLGTTLRSEDRYALRLMQTILGGQSGRLFIELREKKSLAYSVSPVSFEGMERGYAGTYIACAPQKRKEAIDGIRAVLEKLATKGPTAAEMARAKEFFLGRRAMDMQSDSALAAHYGLETLYGIPLSEDDEVVRKVHALTARKVQDVCRKYLIEPHMVTSVVG